MDNIQKVALVIIDGFGIRGDEPDNSIYLASTPTWDMLRNKYPHISINASGTHVGLPDGVMGNSEVGHLTIGTGRITYQSLERINKACKNDELGNNPILNQIKKHLSKSGGRLHLMGLISDGGVHSHQEHLYYLLNKLKNESYKIYVHAFTDGRDTPPTSGYSYICKLQSKLDSVSNASLSSIIGRYYVMDRDKKWDRTKIAYDMLVKMEGSLGSIETIKERYSQGENDEFLKPIVIDSSGAIREGDAVIFFNFRPDRARQITMALNNFWDVEKTAPKNLFYSTMTSYLDEWKFPIFFKTGKIKNSLAEVISNNNLTQSHVAETEKFAHVTYFLNGGNEPPFDKEARILVPSLKVATYDLQPSMSTIEIAEKAVSEINKEQDFVVVNIAAPDMVGHTGIIEAAVEAIETTDKGLEMIYNACIAHDYILIIISDHGNCEQMLLDGKPHTAHTTNKVPFLVTSDVKLSNDGGLSNIAATVLQLMGIEIPDDITGSSLLI